MSKSRRDFLKEAACLLATPGGLALTAGALNATPLPDEPEKPKIDDAYLASLIEKNRKGDFAISFGQGKLPAGAQVTYEMTRLGFDLGVVISPYTSPLPEADADRRTYLDKLKYFNAVTGAFGWPRGEPAPGKFIDDPILSLCQWCLDHGKEVFLQGFLYGWLGLHPGGYVYIQPWVLALDKKQLEEAIKRWMRHVLTLFDGKISNYILINEVLQPGWGIGPDDYYSLVLGFKTLAPYFRWAKEIAPQANFYTNEYDVLAGKNAMRYVAMLHVLLDAGASLGGIGCQAHFFGETVPPSELLWWNLNAVAVFDLPLRITEFGVRATDEKRCAEDLVRFYRVCFAHPQVVGVTRWRFWQPEMWPADEVKREAPLWRKDWSPTPAAEAYINLVTKEWATQGTAKLDAQGRIGFRGFYGKYRISVGGKSYTVELTRATPSATVSA